MGWGAPPWMHPVAQSAMVSTNVQNPELTPLYTRQDNSSPSNVPLGVSSIPKTLATIPLFFGPSILPPQNIM